MRILQVVLVVASAGLPGFPVQETTQKDPAAVRLLEPEFNALILKYGAATRDYDDRRVRAVRAGNKDPQIEHPSRQFLAEFLALAERDSGGAQGWVLESLRDATSDPAERVRIAKEIFPKLLAAHANEDSALHAIEGIKQLSGDLGETTAMEMASSLEKESTIAEVKASALLLQAWLHSEGGKTKDPDRWEDTNEIYRNLLYLFPETRAGKEAAGILIGPVSKAFYEAERRWVDTIAALQAGGKSPDEWPRQPIHDFSAQFQPIAAARHHTAQQFVNKLYPAYEQAENQGKPFAYQWLAMELGQYYADSIDGPWNALRGDLLTVLYRQYPGEKWVLSSVRNVLPAIETLPPDHVAPGFQALLDKSQDPRVREFASFALAQTLKMRGDQRSYEKAIELFTRVRDEFKDGELRFVAENGRSELARCMPGQPAPSAPAPDADNVKFSVADYRGRVVMLEFWSVNMPGCLEAVPSRAALVEELAGKPFSMLGVNIDGLRVDDFREKAKKAGIGWRTALVYYNHAVMDGWEVRRYPTTILIDKKGIIRARQLPWDEMVALARKLVDEPE